MKKIALLGSTGSIGQSTLSLCESYPDRFCPVALAAGSNLDVAFAQCERWRPQVVSIAAEQLADALSTRLREHGITGIEVVYGTAGTVRVATHPDADFVVSAIVGVAGLEATYAAVLSGKTVGLANKECLVAAGDLILAAARLRWPLSQHPPRRLRAHHPRPGPEAPHLGHGSAHHRRLRHHAQQGP